ncbi:c-type cytochrome [Desulfuromonas versatilis]|uniref:C-type cytochrome n=1 Tax=Desulfuromonas versatilis TaxID=2802975 RepID=A0ABM8HSF3_9BACT|nr:tetrathionate reductase family octaheme c-type cytochrome [Desulfuromonas versatilis]BCR03541.1 c-type cytochrome [Desulfuromonas versatilis]
MKYLQIVSLLAVLIAGPALAASHQDRIKGPIAEPQEVTRQCLQCHESEARDFMKTSHWNWGLVQEVDGKQVERGKKNALNNYCTSVAGNEQFCAKCHAGYGLTDVDSYDFKNPENVDCLVCHDTTGTYVKGTNLAGYPIEKVDLLYVAANVGRPNRDNCGQCHFYGGGGDAVKHGDLDSSMAYPDRNTDVHMNVEGNDFACVDCHATNNHQISGNSLGVSPGGRLHIACTGCHEGEIHSQSRINAHLDSVACQTCHIPTFATNLATKIWWDWSKAGEERQFDEKDEYGHHTYVKKKGEMKYAKNVVPEYHWYNGTAEGYQRGEQIDPEQVVRLAYPLGDRGDQEARIHPFKVMRGKQIYDTRFKNLITAKVANDGGYWVDFDWDKAARLGSKAAGLPYSGEYGFVETEMHWRINHMVVPKQQALGCLDCHGDNGRLDWQKLGYPGDPMSNPDWARSH